MSAHRTVRSDLLEELGGVAVVNPTREPESVLGGNPEVQSPELLDRVEEQLRAIRILVRDVLADVDELQWGARSDQDSDGPVHAVLNGQQEREAVLQHRGDDLLERPERFREQPECCGRLVRPDVQHGVDVAHETSPSTGESAEPGLASTLSVEGDLAAGASVSEAPAAPAEVQYKRVVNPAALRAIRELAGVKSGDLARAAGISHSFLSNIEAGRKQPSPSVTHTLARRLGVPIDAITVPTSV